MSVAMPKLLSLHGSLPRKNSSTTDHSPARTRTGMSRLQECPGYRNRNPIQRVKLFSVLQRIEECINSIAEFRGNLIVRGAG